MKSEQMKRCIFNWISSEIDMAEQYGIPVNVDGIRYLACENEKLFRVLEDATYMKEYLGDPSGKIIQINFDKVSQI